MESNLPIPLRIVKLLIGHFHNTIPSKELDELEEWMSASDENLEIFEECLDITMQPKLLSLVETDDDDPLEITWLILKSAQRKITRAEKRQLKDYLKYSELAMKLVEGMPETRDLKIIYYWLIWKMIQLDCIKFPIAWG